jgi:enolase
VTAIQTIAAWEALDSRGTPTVAVAVTLSDGSRATALAPSGASAGSHEARELRDGGTRYRGAGVRRAVANVTEKIAPSLIGRDAGDPTDIDAALEGLDRSAGFSELGGNAVLAVSLATWRAAGRQHGSLARLLQPTGPLLLPMPMVNVVSGGAHAGRLIDIQDVLVVPHGASDATTAIEWAARVRQEAAAIAVEAGYGEAVLVADEGGLGLPLSSNRAALRLVVDAVERAGLEPGRDASLALDLAATEFWHDGVYDLASEGRQLDSAALIEEVAGWLDEFPVVSVEDILAEDDWSGWARATRELGDRVRLVGDDLFVTNRDRVDRGIAEDAANAVLVKVNQRGTVSGAFAALERARSAGWETIVSARSGDTEQSWLVDLAVGWSAGQIKVGSTHRSERTAKWNRMLELEATEKTVFAGPWPRTLR